MADEIAPVATVVPVNRLRRAAPPAAARPMTVKGLLGRFLVAGLLSTSVVVTITALISRRTGMTEATREARRSTWIVGAGVIEPMSLRWIGSTAWSSALSSMNRWCA
jgi:hypothetical protein